MAPGNECRLHVGDSVQGLAGVLVVAGIALSSMEMSAKEMTRRKIGNWKNCEGTLVERTYHKQQIRSDYALLVHA